MGIFQIIFIGKKLKIKEMDCKKAEAQLRNRCDPKNKWSKKGSPGNKKAAILGLAHEPNQKLTDKKNTNRLNCWARPM